MDAEKAKATRLQLKINQEIRIGIVQNSQSNHYNETQM